MNQKSLEANCIKQQIMNITGLQVHKIKNYQKKKKKLRYKIELKNYKGFFILFIIIYLFFNEDSVKIINS